MGKASFKKKAIVLTLFFICGACSAVLGNLLYNMKSTGLHNVVKPFRKPWFQGWSMFVAMSLLIFDTPFYKNCKCPEYEIGGTVRGWGLFRLVSVPALCDLGATVLQNVGLLYLSPSVWQMTRGSILLFTALFSIFYRHKKLYAVDWIGVATTIIGICFVGLSAVLGKSENDRSSVAHVSTGTQIFAMFLVVIAQALQAFQTIVEEEMLHDVDATENEIVSYEGIWGFFFSTFIALPIANIVPEDAGEGLFEHSIETFIMIKNSWPILIIILIYMSAILGYNFTGMVVTSFSSAIHRNIYEALRSAAVWLLSVIIHYTIPSTGAGESLNLMSLVQLFGFSVSILGSFIYNRVIRIPCLYYDDVQQGEPLLKKEEN
jgi:drug/metabolite transporter (DMT)-like permease